LELAGAENEILGGGRITKKKTLLRDAERQLHALGIDDVLEVRENSLRGFRAQIDNRRGVFNRTHEGFEHQVEIARRRQFATACGAAVALNPIGAETLLAVFAIDQRVGEVFQMTRRFPGARMLKNRRIEPEHVAAVLHHLTPPRLLDVALQLDAQRAVVEGGSESPVDVARWKNNSTALAQVDQFFHRDRA